METVRFLSSGESDNIGYTDFVHIDLAPLNVYSHGKNFEKLRSDPFQ